MDICYSKPVMKSECVAEWEIFEDNDSQESAMFSICKVDTFTVKGDSLNSKFKIALSNSNPCLVQFQSLSCPIPIFGLSILAFFDSFTAQNFPKTRKNSLNSNQTPNRQKIFPKTNPPHL
jgi:hypothetical protein